MSWVVNVVQNQAPTEICYVIEDEDVDLFLDQLHKEDTAGTLMRVVSMRPTTWVKGQPISRDYDA